MSSTAPVSITLCRTAAADVTAAENLGGVRPPETAALRESITVTLSALTLTPSGLGVNASIPPGFTVTVTEAVNATGDSVPTLLTSVLTPLQGDTAGRHFHGAGSSVGQSTDLQSRSVD